MHKERRYIEFQFHAYVITVQQHRLLFQGRTDATLGKNESSPKLTIKTNILLSAQAAVQLRIDANDRHLVLEAVPNVAAEKDLGADRCALKQAASVSGSGGSSKECQCCQDDQVDSSCGGAGRCREEHDVREMRSGTERE